MAERKLLELAARGSFPLSRRKLKPRKPYDPASDNGRIALNYGPFDDRVWKAPAAYVPEDERPPASCEFCDENFHPRNKCPSLASVQAIKLAMDRLRSSPNPPHDAKDQFCELELWLVWREEQEGRRAVSIAQEQDEQLRRSQSSSRTERHSFEVDEPSLRATPGPERHSIEADDPFLRATPEPEDELGLKRAMATRLETSGCNIPSGFARLALPASVEEQKADFRRPLVGMLAKSPWYPQSPREPLRYYEAKRAVDAARATKLEKLVVRAYESECQTWQKGVEAFLSLHSADERNFKMKWEVQMLRGPRTDQNLHELVKKYQSAVVPSTMLGRRYKEDFGDATTPTFVRHAIMNGHSLLQPPLVQKSHARQFWHLSNVDWYLGFIPSNSPSMKRADGSLGEHDPRLGMQWHIPGKWYMAFHESPFHHEDSNKANWTTKFHQDATRDFYWYSLDRQHCSRESTEGPDGFSHCFVYHLGAQLITSLVSCHDGMLHLVESVRTDQGALPDLPAEALQAANQVMRQLLEVGMSGRRLVDMIGRYQRLVGEVRAYVYYRRELAKLAKISRRAGNMNSLHVPPANAMLQGWDRRGVLTDDQKTAFHYAQFNIPVGYLHFHDRSFIPGGVQMQVVHLDLCQEVWEDSSDAPPQAPQALRSDLDSHPASGSGRDARLDDMLSFGGVDVFDGSEMDMDVHAAMTEHVSPVQKVPSSSSSTEPSLPVAPPPSRPRPPPRSSTIRNTPSSSTVRNPADTKRRRDESDVAELQEDAEDALKQPRRKKLRQFERNTAKHQPPDWFPVACLVSQQAAMAAPASFERQNAVANRAVFPISSGLSREKMMRHVVPPIDVLLGKSAEYITSMVLRNVVIIAPYLDQRVENLAYDEEEHGLPLTNWQSVLKGHTNDWDHVQGAPNPVARRALAVELGMLSALDGPPRLLELCTPRFVPPADDEDDDDYSGPSVSSYDPHGPLQGDCLAQYFTQELHQDERQLASESERAYYEPMGWRRTAKGARGVRDFTWYYEDEFEEGIIAFKVLSGPREYSVDTLSHDAWVCYELGAVFMLNNYADPAEHRAIGERKFGYPVLCYNPGEGKSAKAKAKPRQDIRVWHHLDLVRSLPIPADMSLDDVGSRSKVPSRFMASKQEMDIIVQRQRKSEMKAIARPQATATSSSVALQSWSMRNYMDAHVTGSNDRPKPITLDGTVLPLWDHTIEKTTSFTWMAPRMRSYVAWRLSEQYWRFSLEHLDTFLISIGHVRTTDARTDRHAKVAAAFGGGTYVPRTNNPLVAATWSERVDAVLRFHDIVNSWPCMSIPIPDGVRTEEEIFTEFERAVHGAFAETYRDYYCRPAPVLYHRPSGLDVPTAIPIPKFC